MKKYKNTDIFKTTIAGSPLCHVSVTRFCKENGYESGSKQRSERSARLTTDMAYFVAVQLNKMLDSKYEKELTIHDDVQECRSCHGKGNPLIMEDGPAENLTACPVTARISMSVKVIMWILIKNN